MIEIEVQGVEVGTDWSNLTEVAATLLDWIDPLVAILERVPRPFGCALLAIALDSKHPPIYYERLLEDNGVEVIGIEIFGLPKLGDFICNGCACMTIHKKDVNRAVRLLTRAGALFAY